MPEREREGERERERGRTSSWSVVKEAANALTPKKEVDEKKRTTENEAEKKTEKKGGNKIKRPQTTF